MTATRIATFTAALLLGAATQAQFIEVHHELHDPFKDSPPAFGESLLLDPVDVAVTNWGSTTSWTYVADAGSNKVVRWVVTGDGSAHVPFEWTLHSSGPWGVAVNDVPWHIKNERVYTTGESLLTGETCIMITDKWGNFYNEFYGAFLEELIDPRGIAVGPEGNVFVVDAARRKVYEFDPDIMEMANTAFPLNTYGSCTQLQPLDVSVDLMRRVHVGGLMFFPFAVGFTDVYEYGNDCHITQIGSSNFAGIDARDYEHSRYATWDGNVRALAWPDVVLPFWDFTLASTKAIDIDTAAAEDLGGLEVQPSWRIHGVTGGGERIQRCDERVFVTDRADGEVEVLQTYELSTARPDDAVAWWRLDESTGSLAKDILNNRHGTWSTGSAVPDYGVVRKSMDASGGDGVVVPDHSILAVGSSDFSVEMWIRSDSFQPGDVSFLDKRSGSGVGYRAFLGNGVFEFSIDDGADAHTTSSGVDITDGMWHHVAAVVTRGVDTRLYVDGTLVATGASAGVAGSLSSGADLNIGRDNTGTTGLDGNLDEVTLYHAAITSGNVGAIHGAGCAGKHMPPIGHIVGPFGTTIAQKVKFGGQGLSF